MEKEIKVFRSTTAWRCDVTKRVMKKYSTCAQVKIGDSTFKMSNQGLGEVLAAIRLVEINGLGAQVIGDYPHDSFRRLAVIG